MNTRIGNNTRIDEKPDFDGHTFESGTAVDDSVRWQFSRYDLFLALLPLPLLLGAAWATVTAAPLSAGVNLGSVPTLALLAYALFIGGPTRP